RASLKRTRQRILRWNCASILKKDQAGANASAASRINCDCVPKLIMRCRSYSPRAVSFNARCALTSVACCSASRCDPHSTAYSVLANVGMQSFSTGLCLLIGRYSDEVVARCMHHRTSVAAHQDDPFWLRCEMAGKGPPDVLRLYVAQSKARCFV